MAIQLMLREPGKYEMIYVDTQEMYCGSSSEED